MVSGISKANKYANLEGIFRGTIYSTKINANFIRAHNPGRYRRDGAVKRYERTEKYDIQNRLSVQSDADFRRRYGKTAGNCQGLYGCQTLCLRQIRRNPRSSENQSGLHRTE